MQRPRTGPDLCSGDRCDSGKRNNPLLVDHSQNEILRPCILWTDIRSDLSRTAFDPTAAASSRSPSIGRTSIGPSRNFYGYGKMNRRYGIRSIGSSCPRTFFALPKQGNGPPIDLDGHGTLLFDVPRREWSRELCDLLGVPLTILPPRGLLRALPVRSMPEATPRFGLCEGTPVVVGTTDQAAEAFGTGAVEPGQGIIKLATAGNVAVVTSKPHPHPPMVKAYYHLNFSCWYTLKGMISCASNYRWLRDSLCLDEKRTAETLKTERRLGLSWTISRPRFRWVAAV